MQTLDDLIAESVSAALNSDSIRIKVQAAAAAAITEAIKDAFGYSGPFRKQIKEAVEKVLPSVSTDDFIDFAAATREIIQTRLASLANETAKQHIQSMLDDMLPGESVIELSELKKEFARYVAELRNQESGCHCDEDDESSVDFYWEVERSIDSTMKQYWYIHCSADEDSSKYSSKNFILRMREDDDGLSECWSVNMNNEEIKATMFAGPHFGWIAKLYRLKTGLLKVRK